jgi:hypothetical protein
MGGQIDQSSITEDIWEMPRDYVGFHVSELEEKLESGFSRASANIVSLAIEQMDAAINARLLRLFQAAIPDNTSPYYITAAGLSLASLNTAIAEVQDESRSDIVSIIGRSTMTGQIIDELADLNGFTPETNEEMLRNGRLGVYRGANIIRLRNFRNAAGVSMFPANELYVVGTDAAKVGFWGGLRAQEWRLLLALHGSAHRRLRHPQARARPPGHRHGHHAVVATPIDNLDSRRRPRTGNAPLAAALAIHFGPG